MSDQLPAWRVEISWFSSIVGPWQGWLRQPEKDRVFRTERKAQEYAKDVTGVVSILVPYMYRRGVVVETTRPRDWRDAFWDEFWSW